MKIKTHDYRGRAEDSMAGFALEFYKNFWECLPIDLKVKLTPIYYEVNRAIGEAIKSRVKIIGASYEMSDDLIKNMGDERADENATFRLAQHLVDELIKTESIAMQKGRSWREPVIRYEVTIPFIIVNEGTFK